MSNWIDSLPLELRHAITESDIVSSLAPFRDSFTATFGAVPSAPPDRSAFFDNVLISLESVSGIESLFNILADTAIARAWRSDCTRNRPVLTFSLLLFLSEVYIDIARARSCASLLSEVLCSASCADIWQSVFEMFNASAPSPPPPVVRSLRAPVTLPAHTSLGAHQDTTSSTYSLTSSAFLSTYPPSSSDSTRLAPVEPNSGSSLTDSGTHFQIDGRLRQELRGLTCPNTPGFMDAFFSSYSDAAVAALEKLSHLRSATAWNTFPSPPRPTPVESWFLALANSVVPTSSSNHYSASPTKPLAGHNSSRKPDLYLHDSSAAPPSWTSVLVVGELKQSRLRSLEVDVIVQFAGYIRLIFTTQPARRFVHAFTLCGNSMRCWIFHRGGALGGPAFSIHSQPELFLRTIIGYASMGPAELGFDTTLRFGGDGILVGTQRQRVVLSGEVVFAAKSIASRGTTCWDAGSGEEHAVPWVLKDSWRSVMHGSEGVMLALAHERGVVGIVEYIAHEDVVFDGAADDIFGNVMRGLTAGPAINLRALPPGSRPSSSTYSVVASSKNAESAGVATKPLSTLSISVNANQLSSSKRAADTSADSASRKRPKSAPPSIANRIHTRLVTVKGRSIMTFTSARELLHALFGAISGHRSLYTHGILHRDISLANLMIPLSARADGLRGFLLDLDLATLTTHTPSGAPHRTGTTEFMAIGVLHRAPHRFHHDLQSFFYVLVWLCVYHRPGMRVVGKDVLGGWGGDYEAAANIKWGHVSRGMKGARVGLEHLMLSFEAWAWELRPLVRGWRDVLFPVVGDQPGFEEGEGLYDSMLGLLVEALGALVPEVLVPKEGEQEPEALVPRGAGAE